MSLQHTALPVHNLECAGGARTIERSLHEVPGVTRVYVNPVTEMAYVEYDGDRCDERALGCAIVRAGYGAPEPPREESQREESPRGVHATHPPAPSRSSAPRRALGRLVSAYRELRKRGSAP